MIEIPRKSASLKVNSNLASFFWPKPAAVVVSPEEIAALLKNGALILDVRNPEEFAASHLDDAINLPVDRIAGLISERVTDKDQPLLLHCHAGVRSASAKKILEQLGYTNLVDLGSYGQAEAILRAARG